MKAFKGAAAGAWALGTELSFDHLMSFSVYVSVVAVDFVMLCVCAPVTTWLDSSVVIKESYKKLTLKLKTHFCI